MLFSCISFCPWFMVNFTYYKIISTKNLMHKVIAYIIILTFISNICIQGLPQVLIFSPKHSQFSSFSNFFFSSFFFSMLSA